MTCSTTTGSLQVSSSTSGPSPDADGYTVTVDGTERGTVGANGELGVEGLALGKHMVGLTHTAANCTVEGPNPRSVIVSAAAETAARFRVTCSGPLASRIAFGSDRFALSYKLGIYIMNADGSNAVQLTDGPLDMSPAWSPDGSKIAFMRDFEIYVMNVDGSGATNLTNNGGAGEWPAVADGSPAWSPDGSKIAFGTYRDRPGGSTIWVMNADGTGVIRLTTGPAQDQTPDWSPDGRKIAFARRDNGGGHSGIVVMNADGTEQRYLSNYADDLEPDWAPDGSRIVFSSSRHAPGDNLVAEIYVMEADGSGITRLTYNNVRDYSPAWSSDGSKIAFTTTDEREAEVYTMNPDGSGQTNLTNNPLAFDSEPSWSPR